MVTGFGRLGLSTRTGCHPSGYQGCKHIDNQRGKHTCLCSFMFFLLIMFHLDKRILGNKFGHSGFKNLILKKE